MKMHMGKLFTANVRRKFRYAFNVFKVGQNNSGESPLTAYVRSITSPTLTLEPVEVIHQTEKVYYPGRITWGTVEVTLVDTDEDSALNLIWEEWVKKYYVSPEMGYVSWNMSDVKKKCEIIILNNEGKSTAKWTLEGCWPTVLTPGDWDYSSSEAQEISFTLQFDRAYYSEDV